MAPNGQVRVACKDLRTYSGNYKSTGDDFESRIGCMEAMISKWQSIWKGATASSYAYDISNLRCLF